jgi:hypothetical protein
MKILNLLSAIFPRGTAQSAIATVGSMAILATVPNAAFFPEIAAANAKTEGFQTPTGNIHCAVYGNGLRCEISENTAKLPPQPADCNLDWGNAFGMSVTGASIRVCHGDTIKHGKHPVLGYGKTWLKDGYSCTSKKTGVTCINQDKKGWEISKTKQRLF